MGWVGVRLYCIDPWTCYYFERYSARLSCSQLGDQVTTTITVGMHEDQSLYLFEGDCWRGEGGNRCGRTSDAQCKPLLVPSSQCEDLVKLVERLLSVL